MQINQWLENQDKLRLGYFTALGLLGSYTLVKILQKGINSRKESQKIEAYRGIAERKRAALSSAI